MHVNFYDSREKVSGMDLAEIVVLSSVAAEWATSRIIPQKNGYLVSLLALTPLYCRAISFARILMSSYPITRFFSGNVTIPFAVKNMDE